MTLSLTHTHVHTGASWLACMYRKLWVDDLYGCDWVNPSAVLCARSCYFGIDLKTEFDHGASWQNHFLIVHFHISSGHFPIDMSLNSKSTQRAQTSAKQLISQHTMTYPWSVYIYIFYKYIYVKLCNTNLHERRRLLYNQRPFCCLLSRVFVGKVATLWG